MINSTLKLTWFYRSLEFVTLVIIGMGQRHYRNLFYHFDASITQHTLLHM